MESPLDDPKPQSLDGLRLLDELTRAIGGFADPAEVAARGLEIVGTALGAHRAVVTAAVAGGGTLAGWTAGEARSATGPLRGAFSSIPEGGPSFTREDGHARAGCSRS